MIRPHILTLNALLYFLFINLILQQKEVAASSFTALTIYITICMIFISLAMFYYGLILFKLRFVTDTSLSFALCQFEENKTTTKKIQTLDRFDQVMLYIYVIIFLFFNACYFSAYLSM